MTSALFGLSILSTALIVLCFYFTLTFFQHIKSGDERLAQQSKVAAVILLAASLLLPAFVAF
ncbi:MULTISPECIES: hypothetical protein [Sporosarcina]|uniref:Uncharacterized protein n=1 Tax=Sporosarcina saromensis TaxID=359365 RepID=A0ABU4GC31_9BACL|nr:hypothetical protein [Sporosarcina saromensis]MDW0114553.1 hypothetical protein [Sporosarcina saromensis]